MGCVWEGVRNKELLHACCQNVVGHGCWNWHFRTILVFHDEAGGFILITQNKYWIRSSVHLSESRWSDISVNSAVTITHSSHEEYAHAHSVIPTSSINFIRLSRIHLFQHSIQSLYHKQQIFKWSYPLLAAHGDMAETKSQQSHMHYTWNIMEVKCNVHATLEMIIMERNKISKQTNSLFDLLSSFRCLADWSEASLLLSWSWLVWTFSLFLNPLPLCLFVSLSLSRFSFSTIILGQNQ